MIDLDMHHMGAFLDKASVSPCWLWRFPNRKQRPIEYEGYVVSDLLWEIVNNTKPWLPLIQTCETPFCINPEHYRERERRTFRIAKPFTYNENLEWFAERIENPIDFPHPLASTPHWIWIGPQNKFALPAQYGRPKDYESKSVPPVLWRYHFGCFPTYGLSQRCAQPACVNPLHFHDDPQKRGQARLVR